MVTETERQKTEVERFGVPDFIGEWENHYRTEYFGLYILRREPAMGRVDRFIPNYRTIKIGEMFEGMIIDDVGIAVASGIITPEMVNFEKRYSHFVVIHKGGISRLVYEGQYDKDTGMYVGTYVVPGTKISATFWMKTP